MRRGLVFIAVALLCLSLCVLYASALSEDGADCQWVKKGTIGLHYETYYIRCGHVQCIAIITDDDVELSCR